MHRVFVQSFGCRASQADGAAIACSLAAAGHVPVATAADADLIVLNTCTVTASADADMRRFIRGMHREYPGAKLLVTGCYAQRAPDEIAALEGVEWVVGNSHKSDVAALVGAEEFHGRVFVGDFAADRPFGPLLAASSYGDRARPVLKIQDGCSNRCSFCIIPAVRGRSRSAPLDAVVEQVARLAEQHTEVVLSGINLGRWGRELPGGMRLPDLVRILLRDTGVQRLRLSSVEPMDWTGELLELMASDTRLAQHIHAPLQSGSDRILKRMHRKYRVRHYVSRLELAAKLMPDGAIGADVMVGFPGETKDDFEETRRLVDSLPFAYLHVFTYSERPGTAAAADPDQVPVRLRRQRNAMLRASSDAKQTAFQARFIGRELSAVTLADPRWALTTNYMRVKLARPRQPRQLVELRIGSAAEGWLEEQPPNASGSRQENERLLGAGRGDGLFTVIR